MFSPIPEVAFAPVWSVARLIAPYASRVEGTRIARSKPWYSGISDTTHTNQLRSEERPTVHPHGRDSAFLATPALSNSGLHNESSLSMRKYVRLARIPKCKEQMFKLNRIERQDYFGSLVSHTTRA